MKTVVVTGGSRGIGKCIAENLAKEGYNVVLNYNKSLKEAKKIKEELENEGIKIEIYKADVSKREEVAKMIKFTLSKFGNIDVLINNAGIAKLQMFNDITDEDWNEMLGTNLNSAFFAIQEVLLITQEIKDAISEGQRKEQLRNLVYTKDVITLLQDGLFKVIAGFTTFNEILKLVELDDELNIEK